jgi:ubiquinone/menaquinone biosynthesis C-methylase UbiE
MTAKPQRRAGAPSASVEDQVAQHYARGDLTQAIFDALSAAGKDLGRLTPDDLAPVDEFHTGGRQATVALAEQVDFARDMHLIDIGCGIGGPSRYFAAQRGCRVTGIDLTHDYVATADALARHVGLSARVAYRQASALALPFEDGTFDGAYMMHVGMNITDKPALFGEVRRVLKTEALFAVYDMMRIGEGELRFPLHWAVTREMSSVASPADYRAALKGAGFEIVKARDRGDFARAFFREVAAKSGGEPPPLGIHLLMKTQVAEKLANVVAGLEGGVIAPIELICRAR